MKRFSGKRAQIQREYLAMLKRKPFDGYCDGCLLPVPVTPSHLIPRSYAKELIAEEENVHWHCQRCAELCELGEYPQLADGYDIYIYILTTRPDYLAIKAMKYEARHGKPYPW